MQHGTSYSSTHSFKTLHFLFESRTLCERYYVQLLFKIILLRRNERFLRQTVTVLHKICYHNLFKHYNFGSRQFHLGT